MLRDITIWVILLAPTLVIAYDIFVWLVDADATISGVVRDWSKVTPWPEFIYVLGVVILYLHLFRCFPEDCLGR